MLAEVAAEWVVLTPQLREVEWRGARVRLSPQRFHLLMVLAGWPPGKPARGNAVALSLLGHGGERAADSARRAIYETQRRLPGLIVHRGGIAWNSRGYRLAASVEVRGPRLLP